MGMHVSNTRIVYVIVKQLKYTHTHVTVYGIINIKYYSENRRRIFMHPSRSCHMYTHVSTKYCTLLI